jgi:hypothetical protein
MRYSIDTASIWIAVALCASNYPTAVSAHSRFGAVAPGWLTRGIKSKSWMQVARGGAAPGASTVDDDATNQQTASPKMQVLYLPGLLNTVVKRTNKVCIL